MTDDPFVYVHRRCCICILNIKFCYKVCGSMKKSTAASASVFTTTLIMAGTFVIVISDNITVNHLQPAIASKFFSMLTPRSIQTIGGWSNVQASDIRHFLYTRNNPNRAIGLNTANPSQITSREKVVVLIHGWLADANSYAFPKLKNEYLKRYDCNLIIVDWSRFSQLVYATSVWYLPKIGQVIANFFCRLNRQSEVNLNTVHLLGHSLGAQLSGFIGQRTLTTCRQKVGRITGMDPAGPLYQDVSISQRLDKSDAIFVDVIHTNQGVLGYVGNCGHVDFYVNCGTRQPGCQRTNSIATTRCNHFRSVDYMSESINSNSSFKAKPCRNCPLACTPNPLTFVEISLGEDCPSNASGSYVLNTNAQSPFPLKSRASDG